MIHWDTYNAKWDLERLIMDLKILVVRA